MKKILIIIGLILLALAPYSNLLSIFSPYTSLYTFSEYLIACLIFALVNLALIYFIGKDNLKGNPGWWFAVLGILVAPPLCIGIPEMTPKLLERVSEEHFRYGMLILSTIVFAIGFWMILKNYWKELKFGNKLIIIPFILCVALLFWDNFSSFNFSSDMSNWIKSGKPAESFFQELNLHELIRTFGRTLIFVLIPWLSLILLKRAIIKKWQFFVLTLFSSIGVAFFFLFNWVDFQFYFPFMIPAISLAPAYWLGLMMISRKNHV